MSRYVRYPAPLCFQILAGALDISNPETILARIIYTEHMYRRPRPQVDVDNISLELDTDSDSDIRILSDRGAEGRQDGRKSEASGNPASTFDRG